MGGLSERGADRILRLLIESQRYTVFEFPGLRLKNQLLTPNIARTEALSKRSEKARFGAKRIEAHGTPRSKRLHCWFADFRSALLRGSLPGGSKMSIEVYWPLRVSGDRGLSMSVS